MAEGQAPGILNIGVVNAPRPRVRDFNPRNILRRYRYSSAQKERALALLDQGLSCRRVARLISPHCSSGTIWRWKYQREQRQIRARNIANFRARL